MYRSLATLVQGAYPRLYATPSSTSVSIQLEPLQAGMLWAVVIPEMESISASVASIKAATGALCSKTMSLTGALQSFSIDGCLLSLDVLYKSMVYVEDASADNDGAVGSLDVMVPTNGTTNSFASYPKLVMVLGAYSNSDGVTFTFQAGRRRLD